MSDIKKRGFVHMPKNILAMMNKLNEDVFKKTVETCQSVTMSSYKDGIELDINRVHDKSSYLKTRM